ncbi:MAG TPA: SAV_6107 family HEPN domain-containing protein [Propionibacteriaceae bacterium]|nr:SAV_6107 family HEPN domain-containing protein [Propionibacteriaceae bacterium]
MSPLDGLQRARAVVDGAADQPPGRRYLSAHAAAQDVLAVVLATRSPRIRALPGPVNGWQLLARVAPEYGEWAAYFAALQPKRQAVLAGAVNLVTEREADDLARDAMTFCDEVDRRVRRRLASDQRLDGQGAG